MRKLFFIFLIGSVWISPFVCREVKAMDPVIIIEKAENAGMKAVIPPRKNRKVQREYDAELYKLRHWVENSFLILKR